MHVRRVASPRPRVHDLEGVPDVSVEAMAIVLHHSRAKGTARTILVGIANHDGDGGAFPSMATLAKYGGCNVRNARAAVARLVELGEVRVHLQAGDLKDPRTGARLPDELQPNRYDVLVTCPSWCDGTKNHKDTRKGWRGPSEPLWINPRSVATGGVDPRSPATPGPPVASDPLTIPSQPSPSQESASTTDRATPCDTCSLERHDCESRWPANGHRFEPKRGRS